MHVPWGWIKQRPHFFAEYLSNDCIVDVYYKRPILISKHSLLTSTTENVSLNIKGFRQISFDKIPIIKYLKLGFINDLILSWQLPDFKKYDYVWFTCASMYLLFKNRIAPNNRIIYDCMDDILEFSFSKNNLYLRNKLLKAEQELMNKSDYVFCSSDYLKDKIVTRTKCTKDVIVVNNAIELPDIINIIPNEITSIITLLHKYPHSLLYIGTISEWFDFTLLNKALDKYTELHLMLVGPTDVTIPMHPQIHYLGTVERKYIFSIMQKAWCLVMPFKVNELIRSVNPVKLYEYIYMGKHVIAPKYGETVKFLPYVHLYESDSDFLSLIEKLMSVDDLSVEMKKQMIEFAQQNTWSNRYQIIKRKLEV